MTDEESQIADYQSGASSGVAGMPPAPKFPIPPEGLGGFDPSTLPPELKGQASAGTPWTKFKTADAAGPWTKFASTDGGPWTKFQSPVDDTSQSVMQAGKNALGGVDAAVSMAAGIPSYIASGLHGLNTLLTTGDIDKAGNQVRSDQESNFGLGAPKPFTKEGQEVQEMLGSGVEGLHNLAHKGEQAIGGGELGNTNADIAIDSILNFLPLPGGKLIGRLGKGLEERLGGSSSAKDVATKLDTIPKEPPPPEGGPKPPYMSQDELPLSNDISQSPVGQAARETAPQADMFESPRTDLPQDKPVAPPIDNMHQMEIDDSDHGYVANQYGGGQDGMRIDENGMPIRADRSMEAQNLQDPLQRNLWGDELPRQSEQEAPRGITSAMDRMSPEDRAAAIKSQFPNSQRGAVNMDVFNDGFNRIKELANGLKLHFEGGDEPRVVAVTPGGNTAGVLNLLTDHWRPNPTSTMEGGHVWVNPKVQGKGIATEMYKFVSELGNDIQPSKTQLDPGKAMWQSFEKNGMSQGMKIPGKQRGAIDTKAFELDDTNQDQNPFKSLLARPYIPKDESDFARLLGKDHIPRDSLSVEEKTVSDVLGRNNYVPKADAPADIVSAALAEGKDGPPLWNNMQSGLQNAAEKTGSALQAGVARWLSYADKMGERYINQNVKPVERVLKALNPKDLADGQNILREEMARDQRFNPDELKTAGLSDKAIAAHQALRKALDDALTVTNASLTALGKKPITPMNAYMASMWQGNWHVPINDINGKLAWYLKVDNKAEANQALAWMKKNGMGATLNLDKATPKYMPSNIGMRVPSDVMGAYQDMLGFFSGDTAAHMQEAMQAYTQEKGFKFQQHYRHFKNKAGVRGYQGDRPWLNERQNAMQQAKAQVNYLRDAYRWAPMQESLANIKQVMSNPTLIKQQPNNMELTKGYVAHSMGLSQGLFATGVKALEQALQQKLSSLPIPKGIQSLGKFVSSLKTMTYLTQLGLSGGYMIATPLQAFLLGPAWHLKLSGQGFGHSALLTSIKALADMGGLVGHPVTDLGKQAYKYMHDNGIISQNILQDHSGLGDYRAVHALKTGIGWTISMPEKVARAATFMSFVHHLTAAKTELPQSILFRRAEELTNHVLTDFRKVSRPLVVDKSGQLGELGYTYKSPLFNQYNNLSIFARDALKGKPGPLLSALAMSAVLGGFTTMPFVNEADVAWNLVKGAVASTWPEHYPKVSGLGVKGTIISKMNELSANDKLQAAIGKTGAQAVGDTGGYGAVSAFTGSQMASRFSSSIGDVTRPMEQMAPVGQEIKEWVQAAHGATNPNKTNITQGIYSAIAPPAVKGNMETGFPLQGDNLFKSTKRPNGQGYVNPNKLKEAQTSYVRTPHEELLRRAGMTSLQEATTKNSRYINEQEGKRFHTAQETSIDNMFDAIRRKDKPDITKYAQNFFANNGDGDELMSNLDKKIDDYAFTPEERNVIKMQSISAIKNVMRMRQLQGK